MQSLSDSQKSVNESPKVWTQLNVNGAQVLTNEDTQQTVQLMATDTIDNNNEGEVVAIAVDGADGMDGMDGQLVPQLHCLESGDGNDYSMMTALQSDGTKRAYCPSVESRQLHNHKERLRRSRMKCSCDALRALVPGLSPKTDKATVLEHTVAFLFHLSKCSGVKCDDYLPTFPPPMSAKLLQLYPTLMSGEYQYYESIPSTDTDFTSNQSHTHIVEVHQTNGTQYVITSDGSQYMVVDNTDVDQSMATPQESTEQTIANTDNTEEAMCVESSNGNTLKEEPIDMTPDECHKCVTEVVDMVTEDKENIDPNAVNGVDCVQPLRKKRAYRKRKVGIAPKKSSTDQRVTKTRKQRILKQNNN